MFGLIKDIEFDEIIGGSFIVGLKIPIMNGHVQMVSTQFYKICNVVDLGSKDLYSFVGEAASFDIKQFEEFFKKPILKNSKLIFKNMGMYIVIGLEFDADEMHNGNITLKDLKIIDELKKLKFGERCKFVAFIK